MAGSACVDGKALQGTYSPAAKSALADMTGMADELNTFAQDPNTIKVATDVAIADGVDTDVLLMLGGTAATCKSVLSGDIKAGGFLETKCAIDDVNAIDGKYVDFEGNPRTLSTMVGTDGSYRIRFKDWSTIAELNADGRLNTWGQDGNNGQAHKLRDDDTDDVMGDISTATSQLMERIENENQ